MYLCKNLSHDAANIHNKTRITRHTFLVEIHIQKFFENKSASSCSVLYRCCMVLCDAIPKANIVAGNPTVCLFVCVCEKSGLPRASCVHVSSISIVTRQKERGKVTIIRRYVSIIIFLNNNNKRNIYSFLVNTHQIW